MNYHSIFENQKTYWCWNLGLVTEFCNALPSDHILERKALTKTNSIWHHMAVFLCPGSWPWSASTFLDPLDFCFSQFAPLNQLPLCGCFRVWCVPLLVRRVLRGGAVSASSAMAVAACGPKLQPRALPVPSVTRWTTVAAEATAHVAIVMRLIIVVANVFWALTVFQALFTTIISLV